MAENESQKKENRLYRFFVPFKNNHGQEIPKERREDFINVVQTEACRKNGGYTSFEARGGYMSDAGQIIREEITVIETYGENPLPPERISHCSNYLAQESLIVMSVGSYEFMDYRGKVDIRPYKLPEKTKPTITHSPL